MRTLADDPGCCRGRYEAFLSLIFRAHADRVQPSAGCGEIYDPFQSVSAGAKIHH